MKPIIVEGRKSAEFKLAAALLVYQSGMHAYATRHGIERSGGAPTLGAGVPLTQSQLRTALKSLGRVEGLSGWVGPEVLYIDTDTLVWWRPAAPRLVHFSSPAPIGKRAGVTPHPHLVFAVTRHHWYVAALSAPANPGLRPGALSQLCHAPYFNVYDDTQICTGNVKLPDEIGLQSCAGFEDAFFDSRFTHSNNRHVTRHPGGPLQLWAELLDTKPTAFPADALTPMDLTLGAWVKRITKGNQ